MNKFKVGDKVRVKENLVVDEFYDDGYKFISSMENTLGKVGEIVRISRNGKYVIKFDCEDYYHTYCYSPSMLESITKNNRLKIYKMNDNCPYGSLKKIGFAVLIVNNPEVIAIDENFNFFTARCHRSDVFNPKIGFEICYKKKRMDELKNEREEKVKELASLEKMIKNLDKDLGKY